MVIKQLRWRVRWLNWLIEYFRLLSTLFQPCPGGSVVSVSDSWPGSGEFDPQLMRSFFPAYFLLLPFQKHERKVVDGFGKKVVLVLVWESQETHVRHGRPWYDLAVKVTLNPNTTIQPTNIISVTATVHTSSFLGFTSTWYVRKVRV